MAETRTQRIESLFHLALPLQGEAREKFLLEACQSDNSLYLEISSLLAHHQSDDEFLKNRTPVGDSLNPAFKDGTLIGSNYKIITCLGKGGMGEVYLARDLRLGRKVALKILNKDLAHWPSFIDRLRREALSASGLNHPNILTIYEFGEDNGLQYIVSEFVEGSSLRNLIGSLELSQTLDYARQVGQALSAAHAAGIVHRDIKPENIMVRPDGFIKVLDFGLAKTDSRPTEANTLLERLSTQDLTTLPGVVLGTINYMSPEQARGGPVDRRTDIWSWGVVLYEMLNARRPQEVLPVQEQKLVSNNKDLNRLLARALATKVDDRYQSMDDALSDLATVRDRGQQLWPRFKSAVKIGFGPEYKKLWFAIAVFAVLVFAGAIGFLAYRHHVNSAPIRIQSMQALTTSGNVIQSAISSDGNYVAYATRENAGQILWLRALKSSVENEPRKLWETTADYTGITFARDGRSIYFVVKQEEVGKLYRLPLPTGVPKMVLNDVDSPASFSPDGGQYVFLRSDPQTHQTTVIIKGLEVGTETNLATITAPDYVWTPPVWSPDGSSVAFAVLSDSSVGPTNVRIMSIAVKDRQQHVVGPEPWYWVSRPIWVKDGRSLMLSATGNNSNAAQLLEMRWPTGDSSLVPLALGMQNYSNFTNMDASADESMLVATQSVRRSNPWIVPLDNPLGARQVTGPDGRFYGVAWTNSGDLISQTDVAGYPNLWTMNPATGASKEITHDASVEEDVSASPEGRYLVYASNREGTFHLWRSNADGSDPTRLTADESREDEGRITPDGKSVIFTSIKSGIPALWLVSIQGGEPVQVTTRSSRKASVSPNGMLIVCDYVEKPAEGWKTTILQAGTGQFVRSFPDIPSGDDALPVQWTHDGKGLLFVKTEKGVSNIWMKPLDGGLATQKTQFMAERIFAFAQSFDGRFLACIRGTVASNVVLVQTAK